MWNISELATRAMKEARQDKRRAKAIFFRLLDQNPKTRAVFDAGARDAAAKQELVLAAKRSQEPSGYFARLPENTEKDEADKEPESILDSWKLMSGKRLGDATMADLIAEAEAHEKLAKEAMRK